MCIVRLRPTIRHSITLTMIDGRSVDVIQNVFLPTNGGEFGRPGKDFTVTETAQRDGSGNFLGRFEVTQMKSAPAWSRRRWLGE